ncbi:hypothetical protein [Clostridium magnum]|uniref:Uncharacterized protein n=1 Tax=Clostridium magnum DSM 2767 TaxID=1121326 RepID=A0A162UMV8_9CLOT|nr:hypothetical protein [Clostridium magnum]KZL94093.1 hypothetical protein CLMAG_11460 [Clostridium magnum DSM 2767]SHH95134.1 hypothetical protein SAMN02745944_01904 [Clostridium magnum DSM 2767]
MSGFILGTVQLGTDYGINNIQGKPSLEKAFSILKTASVILFYISILFCILKI